MPADPCDPRLLDLLARWEELREQGQAVTPEELCGDAPELLPELQRQLRQLHRLDALLPADAGAADATVDDNGQPKLPRNPPGYEILQELGRGGMGVVYQARQVKLNRVVALKMILGGPYAGPRERDRFRREAMAIAALQHPNIVQIYEIGENDDLPYLALEHVGGGNLGARLNGTPQPPREAALLAETLARAVHAAHAQGVIHRDLKPANVLLTADGTPKITDFGLAKRLDTETGPTRSGDVMGTPRYMAPEQASGHSKDVVPATDVHALGIMLYEALTGTTPYRGQNTLQTLEQIAVQEPVSPSRLQPLVPRDLVTICLKCLAKEPAQRYASAQALADDLRRFLNGESIAARPVGLVGRAWRWCRRNPRIAGLTAALVVLGGVSMLVGGLLVGRLLDAGERQRIQEELLRTTEEQRRTEEQLRQIAEKNSLTNYYHALVNNAAERIVESRTRPQLGWTREALTHLNKAADLPVDVRNPLRLRSLAAECLAGVDLQPLGAPLLSGVHAFCIAFSPDGRYLAVGQSKGVAFVCHVCLIDVQTGKTLQRFPIVDLKQPLKTGTRSLAFSRDSRRLAAGTRGGRIYIWDLASGKEETIPGQAHQHEVTGLAFHPEGKVLLSCSYFEPSLAVWDAMHWGEPLYRGRPEQPIDSMVFSPDGSRLVCCGTDLLRVFDPEGLTRPKPVWNKVQEIGGGQFLPCFSPDGRMLAVSLSDQSIRLSYVTPRGLEPGRLLGTRFEQDNTHLSFSADGSLLVSGNDDGRVHLWEVSTGRQLLAFHAGADDRSYPAFSPRGHRLAAYGNQRTVLHDLLGGQEQRVVAQQRWPVRAVAWSPDGALACLAEQPPSGGRREGEVTVWDIASGRLRAARPLSGPFARGLSTPASLAFHPDGRVLAYHGQSARTISLWDLAEGKVLSEVPAPRPDALVFAPDGLMIWAVYQPPGEVSRLAAGSWPELTPKVNNKSSQVRGRGGLTCLAVGQRWVVVGSEDQTTKVFRASNGGLEKDWSSPGRHAIRSVALSPDEKLAASGTAGGRVWIGRVPDGAFVAELKASPGDRAHEDFVETITWSPGGQLLATGGRDGKAHLWQCDGARFTQLLTLPSFGPVVAMSFSPDGTRLALVVENEHAVRVWDLPRLREKLAKLKLAWQ